MKGNSFPGMQLFGGGTRGKIIDLLSITGPLSAKQVHEKLARTHGIEITYQAVHKILQELLSETLLEKRGKNFLISIQSIQKMKKELESIEERISKKISKFNFDQSFDKTREFNFDNHTDLCVSTSELLISRKLAKPKEDDFICVLEYGWWAFKFQFEHLTLLGKIVLANPKTKNIIRKDTPFGRFIRNQYLRINADCAPIGTNVPIEEDVFIQGDHIIEVVFSPETKKLFEHYYSKWKSLDACYAEFGKNPEPKISATVKITKNPQLANFMRAQLLSYFQKKETPAPETPK
jgi:hypothetical protein